MIDISLFSGRCDLCDTIDIFGVDNIISKYKVYGCNHILPFEIKEPKDLIPYYPYLVIMMGSNQETGGKIYLSEESFVDSEEKEFIQYDLNTVLKYYRRCKRNKKPYDPKEALKLIVWPIDETPEEYQVEIVRRVKEFGEKATIDNLHDYFHNIYRKKLFEEMVNNGWDENCAGNWVYGWQEWHDMSKNK